MPILHEGHSRVFRFARAASVSVLLLAAAPAVGQETARQILDRSKAVNDAREPKGVAETMKMTLVDSRGAERVRELRLYAKRYGGGERKTILFFLAPPEVKGVGLLAFSHVNRDDEQWLWLPELARVRQVTSRARRQSFQGSDFTYEDLDLLDELRDWTEANATSRIISESDVGDCAQCSVIELEPAAALELSYSRIVLWIDRRDWITRRIELHGADGSLVKRLVLSDWTPVDGVPAARRVEMTNISKGSKTILELSEIHYDSALSEDIFTQRSLERGRAD